MSDKAMEGRIIRKEGIFCVGDMSLRALNRRDQDAAMGKTMDYIESLEDELRVANESLNDLGTKVDIMQQLLEVENEELNAYNSELTATLHELKEKLSSNE